MQDRALQTRLKILETARELFAAGGLNGTTVDAIADAAQVNKQRIYAYFGSKKQLFEAVLRDASERVELFSRSALRKAEKHPEALTAILLQDFLKVHAACPYFWRLLAWANLEGPSCAAALDQVRQQENESLRRIFNRAVEQGVARNIGFETYLFTLLAVTCFRFSNALTLPHTLGWKPAGKTFEKNLVNELARIFSGPGGAG